jgi:hypothetical protein
MEASLECVIFFRYCVTAGQQLSILTGPGLWLIPLIDWTRFDALSTNAMAVSGVM